MSDKCNKYESLFIFNSEIILSEHLKTCEDCRQEHEKMNQTGNLIKEVKFHYQKFPEKRLNKNLIKVAAGLIIIVLAYFSVSNIVLNKKFDENAVSYGKSDSIISTMGLPVDDYGLLMVY